MKAILISDHAKWCALMMNGDKTVEVRKGTALYKTIQKLIDEYGYADIYVYCTKDSKNPLFGYPEGFETIYDIDNKYDKDFRYYLNGKVIFKFRCYKVEEIPHIVFHTDKYSTKSLVHKELLSKSQLNETELFRYLNWDNGTAIHISDLEVFDKPKELSAFNRYHEKKDEYSACWTCKRFGTGCKSCKITKAPQSWCYIETGE